MEKEQSITADEEDGEPEGDTEIKSLNDFIEKVTVFAQKDKNNIKCYRGHKDKSWRNVPGILRKESKSLLNIEKLVTRELIAAQPEEFTTDHTMFDKLVRMQHFEFATRLMDVSLNPLIALYFATEPKSVGVVTAFNVPQSKVKYYDSDSVSCIANLANLTQDEKDEITRMYEDMPKRQKTEDEIKTANEAQCFKKLAQFIRTEKPYFLSAINPDELFIPYYVHPKMSNRRITAQAGGFIIYGLKKPNVADFNRKRFLIPVGKKKEMRNSLELLGITENALFPELDRAARRIKERYSSKK